MTELTAEQVGLVRGGTNAGPAFGRCGPGDRFQRALGNVFTPECKAHDQAVLDAQKAGSSYVGAQVHALPKLPAAVGSYVHARLQR